MRKLSLLLGTLGGAFAGYLFSNKKLREALAKAKDPEQAAKTLGQHLQKDGKQLARQVREFVESDEVQQNLGKAKEFAKKKFEEARYELSGLIEKGKTMATEQATRAAGATKQQVNRVMKNGRKPARLRTKTRKVA